MFELSNIDRLDILIQLRKKPLKLSHIAKKLKFTVPETARNVSRLCEANLISKDVQGDFHLTPYGKETLMILKGFNFISNHKRYFETHTLSTLPPEYAIGIGILENSEFENKLTTMLFNIENLIRDSQEYVWFVADQLLASGLPLAIEAVKRGVEFKKILPRDTNIQQDILTLANNPIFDKAARAHKFESKYLDKIDIALFISEQVALISFQNMENRFDYLGFIITNEDAHRWTKDLYRYYWDKAKR